MKEIPITRRHKEELVALFALGHPPELPNVRGDLKRVSLDARRTCFELWRERQRRKARDPLAALEKRTAQPEIPWRKAP